MNKIEIEALANNILNSDREVEHIKGLLESSGYYTEISQFEYICEEYITLNEIEKELGLSLTPLNGEKDPEKLKEEIAQFKKIHANNPDMITKIDSYLGLANWLTLNKFSKIKSELERKNESFVQLSSAMNRRRALRDSLRELPKEEIDEVINQYGIASEKREQQSIKR